MTGTCRHVYAPGGGAHGRDGRALGRRPDSRLQDLLKQCGRTLFLLESSDWQFFNQHLQRPGLRPELRLTTHNDDFRRCGHDPALRRRRASCLGDWNFLYLCREQGLKSFPDVDPH